MNGMIDRKVKNKQKKKMRFPCNIISTMPVFYFHVVVIEGVIFSLFCLLHNFKPHPKMFTEPRAECCSYERLLIKVLLAQPEVSPLFCSAIQGTRLIIDVQIMLSRQTNNGSVYTSFQDLSFFSTSSDSEPKTSGNTVVSFMMSSQPWSGIQSNGFIRALFSSEMLPCVGSKERS